MHVAHVSLYAFLLQATAQALDELDPESRKQLPLFGIPFSVKENFEISGYTTSMGCSKFIEQKKIGTNGCVQVRLNSLKFNSLSV